MHRVGLFLFALLAAGCASAPRSVSERDRFPLDPREQLAGPFEEGVARGWDALLAGDLSGAEEEFARAEAGPGAVAARIGLIETWVLDGRADRAVSACVDALRTGEPSGPLLVACGEAYAAKSDPIEALRLYDQALARLPGRDGVRARAEELRKTAREGHVAAAREEMGRESWDAARERASLAMAADPKDPELRVLAAEIEQGAGNRDQALIHYREAFEMGSARPDVEEKIAQMAMESGDHALAVTLFDELARRDERFAERAEEARTAFRVSNWPAPEREAARAARLTRAEAAILVWWMVPEVREARVSSSVIASDVVSRRDSRAVTRSLALGFLDVDPVTHRANPNSPITVTATARFLLRLLGMLAPQGREPACLEGVTGPVRSGAEAIRLAIACGLLPHADTGIVTGSDFTRAVDRIRATVASGENAGRE
ncbi:MAG: tetratricopeptide repeat protein [Thermoanaerobaculia bacterium]